MSWEPESCKSKELRSSDYCPFAFVVTNALLFHGNCDDSRNSECAFGASLEDRTISGYREMYTKLQLADSFQMSLPSLHTEWAVVTYVELF